MASQKLFFRLIIAFIAFAIIAFWVGVYFLIKLLFKKKTAPVLDPWFGKPAHEKALAHLQILEDKSYFEKGKSKEHYSELSFILREYLENRFATAAMETTTPEIINQLKQSKQIMA